MPRFELVPCSLPPGLTLWKLSNFRGRWMKYMVKSEHGDLMEENASITVPRDSVDAECEASIIRYLVLAYVSRHPVCGLCYGSGRITAPRQSVKWLVAQESPDLLGPPIVETEQRQCPCCFGCGRGPLPQAKREGGE